MIDNKHGKYIEMYRLLDVLLERLMVADLMIARINRLQIPFPSPPEAHLMNFEDIDVPDLEDISQWSDIQFQVSSALSLYVTLRHTVLRFLPLKWSSEVQDKKEESSFRDVRIVIEDLVERIDEDEGIVAYAESDGSPECEKFAKLLKETIMKTAEIVKELGEIFHTLAIEDGWLSEDMIEVQREPKIAGTYASMVGKRLWKEKEDD